MSNLGSILGEVLKHYAGVPQSPADVQDVPHHEVVNHYQQYVQQAPPQQVYEAHKQAYEQLPPQQQQSLFSEVVGALMQHGITPQQAGAQGNTPSPGNFASILQYASQHPELFQSIFGQNGALNSPIAKMVLAGALAVAANQFGGSKSSNKDTNTNTNNMNRA